MGEKWEAFDKDFEPEKGSPYQQLVGDVFQAILIQINFMKFNHHVLEGFSIG